MDKNRKIHIRPRTGQSEEVGTAEEVFDATVMGNDSDEFEGELASGKLVDAITAIPMAQVAQNIHDGMTFDEAFDSARGELGPGAVFYWKGNVYGTFLEEEWDALSPEEKDAYWQSLPESENEVIVVDLINETKVAEIASTAQEVKGEMVDESIEYVAAEIVEEVVPEKDAAETEIAAEELVYEDAEGDDSMLDDLEIDW